MEYRKKGECRLSKLLDEVEDNGIKDLITNIATLDNLPDKYDKSLFESYITKVKSEIKRQKLDDLKSKINGISDLDPNKTNEYLIEYQNLLRELGGRNNAKENRN